MIESFITVQNGIITGFHHGDIKTCFDGTPYCNCECIKVPFHAQIRNSDHVTFYTKDWERKSDKQLIDENLITIPDGHILEGDTLREMTKEERIIAGLDEPQSGFRVKNGVIVPMTLTERFETGQITKEEYEETIAEKNKTELNDRLAELQGAVQ